MTKTTLITGASGFFGQALLRELASAENGMRFVCAYAKNFPALPNSRFVAERVDLMDARATKALLDRYQPEVCVHLAWEVPPKEFWTSPRNADWLEASVRLFRGFAERGGRRFVGAGTLAEYASEAEVYVEDETPLRPATEYGIAKERTHARMRESRDRDFPDTSLAWARLGAFFGPDEADGKLIPTLIRKFGVGEPVDLLPADTACSYAHVRYAAQGFRKLAFAEEGDVAVNLAAAYSHRLDEIVEAIREGFPGSASTVRYGVYSAPSGTVRGRADGRRMDRLGIAIPDTLIEDLKEGLKR